MRMTPELAAEFKAGYNDRFDNKPNAAHARKDKKAFNMYASGYIQACDDIVIFKRLDRVANLKKALGDFA